MYIHAVMTAALAFSVFDHDIPSQWKGQFNDATLIRNYIDFIHYNDLAKSPCLNLHFCLIDMSRNAKKYFAHCGIFDKEFGDTDPRIMHRVYHAPCGKIHVQSTTEMPVQYLWVIKAIKDFVVNTTVLKIDIPYETLDCTHNYLHIFDKSKTKTEDIARLCGRSFGKIFYSNTSLVHVIFALKYARYDTDTMLSILYQIHSELRIQVTKNLDLSTSLFEGKLLLLKRDNTCFHVYHYNTYIWNQVRVSNITHTEEKVLIYDGPNSKSKLLLELPRLHAEIKTMESSLWPSLSIVSIYIMQKSFVACTKSQHPIHISVHSKRHIAPEIVHQVPSTDMIVLEEDYEAETKNVLKIIKIQGPMHKFIKIKMSRFIYTGSTEATCYFGGIVMKSVQEETIGPLCGDVGRRIFEDKRLDGLSLSSHTLDIFVFLYSRQNMRMRFSMIISSDECERLPNIVRTDYIGKNVYGRMITNKWGEDKLFVGPFTSKRCAKLQYFIHTLLQSNNHLKLSIINFDNGRRIGEFKMVSGTVPCHVISKYPAYRVKYFRHNRMSAGNYTMYNLPCPNEKNHTLKISSFSERHSLEENVILDGTLCPNQTFHRDSFEFFNLQVDLHHELGCAPMNDGVVEFTFRYLGEVCAKEQMHKVNNISSHLFSSPSYLLNITRYSDMIPIGGIRIRDKCSLTECLLSSGLYSRRFVPYIAIEQINIKVSKYPKQPLK